MPDSAVTMSGPLFDRSAPRIINDLTEDIAEEVAQQGYDEVRHELGQVLRHPSGRYQSRISVERQQNDRAVTDGGIVYGPWLEGTSSRNNRTRFRGYSTFRRVTQRLEAKASDIADDVVKRSIRRLGG